MAYNTNSGRLVSRKDEWPAPVKDLIIKEAIVNMYTNSVSRGMEMFVYIKAMNND